MRRGLIVWAAGAVMMVMLASCASDFRNYEKTRRRWTKRVETYESFESRLFVKATLKTADFRAAYVDGYGTIFALDQATRAGLLEGELAEDAKEHVVIISSFANSLDWEDLDPKAGIWDVRLENDAGRALRPTQMKRLDESNPTWKRLFPYLEFHDRLYEVHFAKNPSAPLVKAGEPIHLIIAGAPAQVKLTWLYE
ncbi:MAG: hypothetical protein R3F39_17165 [Myxococcota bacterium]